MAGGASANRVFRRLLSDGTTYSLDVCRASFGLGARRMRTQLDQLNAWLRAN